MAASVPEESFRKPLTLSGRYLDLVPLERRHAAGLVRAAQDDRIRAFLMGPPGRTVPELEAGIDLLLAAQAQGTDLPFCQVLRATGEPVGMTRYLRIERADRKVEIGGSWLDTRYWRSPLNTESKYLLLQHAFEQERCHRVSLQTDLRNERSQRAIARLGATREGVLREDRRLPSGRFRTSVVYGIVEDEWPRVKSDLEAKLALPWTGSPTIRPG